MQQSLVNLFFSFVCGVTVVSAFHLQSDPSQIARVCTGRINQICQSAGMRCRANQAFDADIPHAVCDRLNGRTRGVRPAALLARQGRMRQQRMGGQFGGMAGNVGRVRGFGRGANGLALNGQTFGGRLGRGMGNGLAGGLGGGMTGGMTRGMNGGMNGGLTGGLGMRGGMGMNGLDQFEFGGQDIGTGLGFGNGAGQFGGTLNTGIGRRQQFTRGLNNGFGGTGSNGVGGTIINRQISAGGAGLNSGFDGLNGLNGGLNDGLNGALGTGGLNGGLSSGLGAGGAIGSQQITSSFQNSGLGGRQLGGSQLGTGLNLGVGGQTELGGSQQFNSGVGSNANQWI